MGTVAKRMAVKWVCSLCVSFLVVGVVCAEELEPYTFDLGPLASQRVDANGDLRLNVLGPFFERSLSAEDRCLWAVRPLYSTVQDPAEERRRHDIVWPIASAKQFRNESSWRFIVAFGQRFDVNDPASRYRVWLLPFYFQGRNAEGRKHLALFPLGGKIYDILTQDEIRFFLFPLWMRTTINEVVTQDYLWPFISRTKGKGIYRFRIFPFYGQAKHREKFKKKFVLWPFWTWAEYKYKGSSGTGYIVFPLWGHLKLTDQESWMILPPLFRFHRGDRINYVYAPWPFFQKSSGEMEKLYLWPLWGRKRMHGVKSGFFLWPIFWRQRVDLGDGVGKRFTAMPIYYAQVKRSRERGEDGKYEVFSRYHKLWPLISYQREGDARRLRLLELWPLKDTGPVERSWAPLWTLYTRTGVGDTVEDELLWGLVRHARRGDEARYASLFPLFGWRRDDQKELREWSVLKGLLAYKRKGDRRSLRLLYLIRIGRTDRQAGAENLEPTTENGAPP